MKYGWRARIGHIRPAASIEGGEEWRLVVPEGVAFIEARTLLPSVTEDGLRVMMEEVVRATREVACAKPDVVIQCGAPGTFLRGVEYERDLIAKMEEAAGVPATTMMTAMMDGLRAFQARRIAVGTIYTDEMNLRMKEYMEGLGFEVVALAGLQTVKSGEVMSHEPDVAYRLGREVAAKAEDADAVLISCGGLRTFEIIDTLEADTDLPVVTSNQAALWSTLRMAGIPEQIAGVGRLLQMA